MTREAEAEMDVAIETLNLSSAILECLAIKFAAHALEITSEQREQIRGIKEQVRTDMAKVRAAIPEMEKNEKLARAFAKWDLAVAEMTLFLNAPPQAH